MNTNFQLNTQQGCWWYTQKNGSRRHVAYTGDHWITLERLMPNRHEEVQVSCSSSGVEYAKWTGIVWADNYGLEITVDAWQPKPEPFQRPFLQEVA